MTPLLLIVTGDRFNFFTKSNNKFYLKLARFQGGRD